MIVSQDENTATQTLATLLRSDVHALHSFLSLIKPDLANPLHSWAIETFVVTDRGHEIDLLLYNSATVIIVEVKIRDGQRAYQFDPYVSFVKRKFGISPILAWLVQRPKQVYNPIAEQATVITWNTLHATFEKLTSKITSLFCESLIESGIVSPRYSKQGHFSDPHGVAILRAIKARIPGLEGDVEQNTRTPLSLHVGREKWTMSWNRRVWFYYEFLAGLKAKAGPYGFVCHLILYNKTLDDFDSERLRKWSSIMSEYGLRFERNEPGKWNRGIEIKAPIIIDSNKGLRGVFAERIPKMETAFDYTNDQDAIEAGVKHLNWGLSVIDSCLGRSPTHGT